MSLATAELPTDPDVLRAFAAALQAELYSKTLHIEKLKGKRPVMTAALERRANAAPIVGWCARGQLGGP
jgi:hypothetical protein